MRDNNTDISLELSWEEVKRFRDLFQELVDSEDTNIRQGLCIARPEGLITMRVTRVTEPDPNHVTQKRILSDLNAKIGKLTKEKHCLVKILIDYKLLSIDEALGGYKGWVFDGGGIVWRSFAEWMYNAVVSVDLLLRRRRHRKTIEFYGEQQ